MRYNDQDTDECRKAVDEFTNNYRENYQSYLDNEEEQCNWAQLILSAMRIKDVQLVDNQDFLEYMRTEVNDITFSYGRRDEGEGPDAGDLPEDL